MNIPPKEYIRVMPDSLRGFSKAAFEQVGLSPEHAATLSGLLVSNDLRGVWSHGTRHQLPDYVRHFQNGDLNPRPDVRILSETPTTVVIDGDGGLGYFAALRAAHEIVPKARDMGLAAATTRNHGHIGAAGLYSRVIAKSEMIAWVTSGHQTNLTPDEDFFAAAGGSPHSFAVPVGHDSELPDIVLDFGAIHDMYPSSPYRMKLFELAPGTVFRSIGMGVMCQTIGGLLCGIPADPARATGRWHGANQGAFLLAIEPKRFLPPDEFKREVQEFARRAQSVKPPPGFERADLPGGPEHRRELEYSTRGIPIGPEHQGALRRVAENLGIESPC